MGMEHFISAPFVDSPPLRAPSCLSVPVFWRAVNNTPTVLVKKKKKSMCEAVRSYNILEAMAQWEGWFTSTAGCKKGHRCKGMHHYTCNVIKKLGEGCLTRGGDNTHVCARIKSVAPARTGHLNKLCSGYFFRKHQLHGILIPAPKAVILNRCHKYPVRALKSFCFYWDTDDFFSKSQRGWTRSTNRLPLRLGVFLFCFVLHLIWCSGIKTPGCLPSRVFWLLWRVENAPIKSDLRETTAPQPAWHRWFHATFKWILERGHFKVGTQSEKNAVSHKKKTP